MLDARIIDDVDRDNWGDLAEVMVGSDPCDPRSRVPDFTDYYFEFSDDDHRQRDELIFTPRVPSLDVVFNVDTTRSMDGEIEELRSGLRTIVSETRARVADAAFGVSGYDDFPVCRFGSGSFG